MKASNVTPHSTVVWLAVSSFILASTWVIAAPSQQNAASPMAQTQTATLASPPKSIPPVAFKQAWQETRHGEVVIDDYRWMHKKEDAKVIAHLNAENIYTEAMSAHFKSLEDKIYEEMKGRIKENDLSVPTRRGAYFYYSRMEAGKQYPINCRRLASKEGRYDATAKEEIILDVNELAKGEKFMAIGSFTISPDANLLAFSTDNTGYRQYQLHVKDLRTGVVTSKVAERTTSIAWANDNQTLFYVQEDPVTKRSDKLFRVKLGSQESSKEIYNEKVEQFGIGVGKTKDDCYLILAAFSTDTSEQWVLDANQPNGNFKTVLGRVKGHRYQVEHRENLFYIRTNKNSRNFRLVSAPVQNPKEKNWKEIVKHDDNALLSSVELFKDYLVYTQKKNALNTTHVHSFKTRKGFDVKFDDEVYTATVAGTPEYTSQRLRMMYQSPVTPNTVMDIDMNTGEREILKKTEVLGGYDASQYESKRLWAIARDGVKIPLWVVYKKGVKLDGNAPTLLYAYGSYGLGMEATFSSSRLSLLDRGVVYVLAQIRGGNDMGEKWHEDGMLMKKKNTFYDFIDSAEFLVKNKWTNSNKLIIQGGSAGGLLMGAVTNMRPDLFKAVHAAVPFVDVMNTMLDPSLPLTTGEYLEWGNPNEKADYDYMKSYSPYDNIEKKAYPSMLVTTGLNDSQVMYWEPAKYVAKLREYKTDNHTLLFKINMAAGHGGASGRYDALKENAFIYAWMLDQWGMAN